MSRRRALDLGAVALLILLALDDARAQDLDELAAITLVVASVEGRLGATGGQTDGGVLLGVVGVHERLTGEIRLSASSAPYLELAAGPTDLLDHARLTLAPGVSLQLGRRVAIGGYCRLGLSPEVAPLLRVDLELRTTLVLPGGGQGVGGALGWAVGAIYEVIPYRLWLRAGLAGAVEWLADRRGALPTLAIEVFGRWAVTDQFGLTGAVRVELVGGPGFMFGLGIEWLGTAAEALALVRGAFDAF